MASSDRLTVRISCNTKLAVRAIKRARRKVLGPWRSALRWLRELGQSVGAND